MAHDLNCACGKCKLPLVPIHLHTSHSALDGCAHIEDYVKYAKQYNHPGIAVTDHGSPTALFDFYKTLKKQELKPILGLEFYMCQDLDLRKRNGERELWQQDKHQSILILNKQGYRNFCKLNYHSFVDGFYYKPRINYEMLFEHNEGLVATSSCMASYINQAIKADELKEAERMFRQFVYHFDDRFYGEIQFNEITKSNPDIQFDICQREINDWIIKMCDKYDVRLLIGGDIHYADPGDHKLQDIVINSKRYSPKNSEKKDSFIHARHLFYHDSSDYFEFNTKFGYNYDEKLLEQAMQNSVDLLESVDFEFDTNSINFPKYQHPIILDKDNPAILREMCYDGLVKLITERRERGEKFENKLIDQYNERLKFELDVIERKQIVDYFLIFQDVCNWAREQGFQVGIARGSAGGSLVSYCIGITEIDPIKYGLMFERFQNPERISLPDIDMDFEKGAREHILEYLKGKYGEESVFSVVTFGTYKAKSALQDVSRALDKDTSFASTLMREVTKLEGLEESTNLPEFFNSVLPHATSTLAKWINENQDTIHWSQKLIGQIKNLGTHAGGILITPGPVYDHIPVTKGSKEVVTAFKEADGSGKDLSELGLLKLDILGLRTLNIIKGCISDVKRDLNQDISLDVKYVDHDDLTLLQAYRQANTLGIFQMDKGAIDLIKMIAPDSFEDVVAINALNRPGPKETFGPLYGKWKRFYRQGEQHKCKTDAAYPKLDFMLEILKPTYGCCVYQEQVMLLVQRAAGFNLGEADNFRRMLGWRPDNPKYYQLESMFARLREKMTEQGYSNADVDYFIEYMRNMTGYAFNRSHSVAYAYTAMQTLYLKVHFPAYFYANMLNFEEHDMYQDVIADAVANGVDVLPPSITKSQGNFSVENGKVRIGLKAIKGFGETAYEEIKQLNVADHDLFDFLSQKFSKFNSGIFKKAVDAGAFDEFEVPREKIEAVYQLFKDPKVEKWFTRKRQPLELKTMPPILSQFAENVLFSIVEQVKDQPEPWKLLIQQLIPYIQATAISEEKKTALQEELLGFSLGHAQKIKRLLELAEQYKELDIKSLSNRASSEDICYWYLISKRKAKTKHGKPYWVLKITDKSVTVNAKCWELLDFNAGSAYLSQVKVDKFGYTIINNDLISEIEL